MNLSNGESGIRHTIYDVHQMKEFVLDALMMCLQGVYLDFLLEA
jgi:hypothetical protein